MREWTRAPVDMRCGGPCQERLAQGDPVYLVLLDGMKRALRRCRHCALKQYGVTPPDTLPALPEQQTFAPIVHLPNHRGTLPLDWKSSGANQREPGEEG